MTADPLIVTAALDQDSAARFQVLRDRHFPADRNIVPAHVTLFHQLPGNEGDRVLTELHAACAAAETFGFTTGPPRFLGRGCALDLVAEPLLVLHVRLSRAFADLLTAQDGQPFRPHITVQNKVAPETARQLCRTLAALPPIAGTVIGLDVWFYRRGPWERADHMLFSGMRSGRQRLAD